MIKLLTELYRRSKDIYSDMVRVDFRPLEYIEIKRKKPLIVKLNDEYAFRCEILSIKDFISFNDSKDLIIENIDKLNKLEMDPRVTQKAKVIYYELLIRLLYEISKNQFKKWRERRKYKKILTELLMNDFGLMLEIFQNVLNYNTQLKKKLSTVRNINIFSNAHSDLTIGGIRLKELIREDPVTGEKYFLH